MEIVIKLGQFLMSLSLLIVLHELGHFVPAKLFKTRVENKTTAIYSNCLQYMLALPFYLFEIKK